MKNASIIQFLAEKVPLFEGFPHDKLAGLVEGSTVTTFEGKEAVIEYGEEGRFLGVLLDGKAEVSVTDNTGKRHRTAILRPGDIYGEISLMTGDRTISDIIGITRCKTILIPQSLFSSLIITHPPAIKYLSRLITERSKKYSFGRDAANEALRKSDDPYGFKLRTDIPSKILIINCGSSSLKYTVFDTGDKPGEVRGVVEQIGGEKLTHRCFCGESPVTQTVDGSNHADAFSLMSRYLLHDGGVISAPEDIAAVGHRVVHGGDRFSGPARINEETIQAISDIAELAPLHNPVNILGIREAMKLFPSVPHVAVFDTTFHHTLPPYAYMYGLPYELYKENKIRRYGFHGMSHLYVSLKAAEYLKRSFNELEIISCHLGNGASMCAIDHGRSVDTSMGFTPTPGLIMGTRAGDMDPSILLYLMRARNMSVDDCDKLINKQSGLKGISGISNDMREIENAAQEGNHRALLAYKSFCYQVRKYIGAYMAAMQGLDAVIFTGGIGFKSPGVRSLSCQGLDYMGIHIDETRNARVADGLDVTDIADDNSPVRVLVIRTDEERMIARETLRTIKTGHIDKIIRSQKEIPIPIEVSAHHVHLSRQHIEVLFGKGYTLTPLGDLSQPDQFACKEQVTLVGPKGMVDRVRVLGPARKETQVEISMTEQFKLGIHPPIRESGDLANTPGITLQSDNAAVAIDKGVICAMRHIHMPPEDALKLGLRDRYMVRVRVGGDRELVFGDVLVRVSPKYRLAMHLDTDEANAANIVSGMNGFIESIQSRN
ncbi:MAG: acetate/propionate family kinase [Chitinivibrionales bacterium]|nr:acetate/propionate family kinase [Chitinivibrionales bacterium]